MKATFLTELEVGDDTDLIAIADELREHINGGFQHEALSCKPWFRSTLTPPGQPAGGLETPPSLQT